MTGRTKLMIALGAAGLGVAAFFLLRGGDEAKATGAVHDTAHPERDLPATPNARRDAARTHANDRRDPGVGDEVGGAGDGEPVKYDLEDGTHVADHRTNPVPYLRPGVPHPSRALVDGKVSTEVLHQIRPIVIQCLAAAPDTAFADDALLMARATIAIDADGNLTATELGADGTGIDEAALTAAVACIRAAAPTLKAHVDHAAVEAAPIAFPFRPLDYRR